MKTPDIRVIEEYYQIGFGKGVARPLANAREKLRELFLNACCESSLLYNYSNMYTRPVDEIDFVKMNYTSDKTIRVALRKYLDNEIRHAQPCQSSTEVIEELGIRHGVTRIDFALINNELHGYEIKSDSDTLDRLPEQMKEFSAVFDQLTLVVGKRHLYHALHIIPDWWGVIIAKSDINNSITFQRIRESDSNVSQQRLSIARLLWRQEALQLLEERDEAKGFRNRPREAIYEKLVNAFSVSELREQVIASLVRREGWRSGERLRSNDG